MFLKRDKFYLKNRITRKGYQFLTYTSAGCLYFPGFDLKNIQTNKIHHGCDFYYFEKIKKILLAEKDSIIIFGGRLPVYLSNKYFDNLEGGVEGNEAFTKYILFNGSYKDVGDSFKNEVLEISKNNNIILIYPIPEVGWNLPLILYNSIQKSLKNYLLPQNYISTSFEVYKNRSKASFELLDSINNKNIYRVYPHTLFCNKAQHNRCITHDDKNIFYADSNHPSVKGSEMINSLIIREIDKIQLKFN